MKGKSALRLFASAALALPAPLLAGPVNINTANAQMLEAELTGVGPALAEEIVRDRSENGEFASPGDLARVRGIGEHVLEMNDGDILVSDPPASAAR